MRARKGTPEGEEASKRWRETMEKRYGDYSSFMKKIGSKGGKNGSSGGFACLKVDENGMTGPQRASKYGTIGGHISKRGPAKKKKTDDCDRGEKKAE